MAIHDWLDVAGWLVLVAVTVLGVQLGARVAKHQKLEDKVNEHDKDIASLKTAIQWVEKLFKRE